jgi:hypothetical protein
VDSKGLVDMDKSDKADKDRDMGTDSKAVLH